MKSEEKVGEEHHSVFALKEEPRADCEIIRQPGTTFSYCIAHYHTVLWETYGDETDIEMRDCTGRC